MLCDHCFCSDLITVEEYDEDGDRILMEKCLSCGNVTDALMRHNRANPPLNSPGGRGKYATGKRYDSSIHKLMAVGYRKP